MPFGPLRLRTAWNVPGGRRGVSWVEDGQSRRRHFVARERGSASVCCERRAGVCCCPQCLRVAGGGMGSDKRVSRTERSGRYGSIMEREDRDERESRSRRRDSDYKRSSEERRGDRYDDYRDYDSRDYDSRDYDSRDSRDYDSRDYDSRDSRVCRDYDSRDSRDCRDYDSRDCRDYDSRDYDCRDYDSRDCRDYDSRDSRDSRDYDRDYDSRDYDSPELEDGLSRQGGEQGAGVFSWAFKDCVDKAGEVEQVVEHKDGHGHGIAVRILQARHDVWYQGHSLGALDREGAELVLLPMPETLKPPGYPAALLPLCCCPGDPHTPCRASWRACRES
ncbi:ATP-dependent RNA helicase ddx23-like isoform X2 [Lathamus discolor]|uniref:ATP-dependent RNA helicase ddx23-like isoform X2 n=1 Tax=Lathamus discolor TaxID=678569 RepID=UPI0032B71BD3